MLKYTYTNALKEHFVNSHKSMDRNRIDSIVQANHEITTLIRNEMDCARRCRLNSQSVRKCYQISSLQKRSQERKFFQNQKKGLSFRNIQMAHPTMHASPIKYQFHPNSAKKHRENEHNNISSISKSTDNQRHSSNLIDKVGWSSKQARENKAALENMKSKLQQKGIFKNFNSRHKDIEQYPKVYNTFCHTFNEHVDNLKVIQSKISMALASSQHFARQEGY